MLEGMVAKELPRPAGLEPSYLAFYWVLGSKLRLSSLCSKVFTPSHFLISQLLVFRLLARFPTMLFGSFITTEFN